MPRTRSRTWSWSCPRRSRRTCPRSRPPRARHAVHHRGELLAAAVSMRRVIAVAGTHGKTTTTAMTAHALAAVRRGRRLRGRRGAAAAGRRPQAQRGVGERGVDGRRGRRVRSLVSELQAGGRRAHERRARPSLDLRVRARGASGVRRVPRRACNPAARSWRGRAPASRPACSTAFRPRPRCGRVTCAPPARECSSRSWSTAKTSPRSPCRCPGEHNVLNALAAIGAVRAAGHDPARAAQALASFQPAGRRFEPKGEAARGARVRRLRAPRDRGRRHACRSARAADRGASWPCSSRTCTRAPRTRTTTSAARWRARTWSWCSTCTGRASARRTTPASAASWSPARRPTTQAGARCGGCPPTRRRVGVLAPAAAEGDLVVTLGAGDVDAVAEELLGGLERGRG